jgi:hypothetical protein
MPSPAPAADGWWMVRCSRVLKMYYYGRTGSYTVWAGEPQSRAQTRARTHTALTSIINIYAWLDTAVIFRP